MGSRQTTDMKHKERIIVWGRPFFGAPFLFFFFSHRVLDSRSFWDESEMTNILTVDVFRRDQKTRNTGYCCETGSTISFQFHQFLLDETIVSSR